MVDIKQDWTDHEPTQSEGVSFRPCPNEVAFGDVASFMERIKKSVSFSSWISCNQRLTTGLRLYTVSVLSSDFCVFECNHFSHSTQLLEENWETVDSLHRTRYIYV